jgi:Holliday junction DNA helicase RuvA
MIGFLEGTVMAKQPGQVLLKVGGVGYVVAISLNTFYALPDPPGPAALYIHTRVQEDALQLYGFADPEEKELFLALLTIPRIGGRIALNILSGIAPEEFRRAVAQGDVQRLAGIPGLGRKSAERITLELKDRLSAGPGLRPAAATPDRTREDALSALVNLGYPKNLAEKALEVARGEGAATLEELLRRSLKWLAK